MKKSNLFLQSAILIFLIFVINTLAMKFFWYYHLWWFDMFMHFLGGFWVGLTFFILFDFSNRKNNFDFSLKNKIIVSLLAVLVIGIFWEVFEFSIDAIVRFSIHKPLDSISDLFFDMSGGALGILYFLHKHKN